MGIGDIFKKKRKEEKQVKVKEELVKETEKVETQPEIKERIKEKNISEAYKILKTPYITEKTTDLAKKNQYIFKVFPNVNKLEIKKAIENLYGVDVLSVKIVKIPKKRRTLGRISGWRKGYKKAIVKIGEGQRIEIIPR